MLELIESFVKEAAQGNVQAMYNLGTIYSSTDEEKARYWYTKAAELGNSDALFNLGYEQLLQQNYTQARTYFLKATLKGDLGASLQLSAMYTEGLGVEKDPILAEYWEERHQQAMENLLHNLPTNKNDIESK